MATKIKDSATAEKAAMNLNTGIEAAKPAEPNAPRELGTTERLFPDFVTSDGAIINRPVPKDVPATETAVVPPQTQTPQTQAPTEPVYIKPEDLTGKMAKIKVDGVEQDVPANELFKLTQLERHSNAQLQKIAQERAQLERERQEFLARTQTQQQPPKKQEPQVKKTAEVEALEARLAQMEQAIAEERALLLPQIQEAGIKRVSQLVKENTGFDDFPAYFDKVRTEAVQEAQKALAAGDINAAKFFDSDAFYYQKYQQLKLRDMAAKSNTPAPVTPVVESRAPVLQTQEGAPVVMTNSGKPVSIPNFESSSGVPSTPSNNESWQARNSALVAAFKANPSEANALAMIKHRYAQE